MKHILTFIKKLANTIYLFLRRLVTLLLLVPISVTLHCWIHVFKNISARQVYLNLGSQLLRSGTALKIGDPQHVPMGKYPNGVPKYKLRYIRNMYFNFAQNRVTVSYTDKPHLIKKENESGR